MGFINNQGLSFSMMLSTRIRLLEKAVESLFCCLEEDSDEDEDDEDVLGLIGPLLLEVAVSTPLVSASCVGVCLEATGVVALPAEDLSNSWRTLNLRYMGEKQLLAADDCGLPKINNRHKMGNINLNFFVQISIQMKKTSKQFP